MCKKCIKCCSLLTAQTSYPTSVGFIGIQFPELLSVANEPALIPSNKTRHHFKKGNLDISEHFKKTQTHHRAISTRANQICESLIFHPDGSSSLTRPVFSNRWFFFIRGVVNPKYFHSDDSSYPIKRSIFCEHMICFLQAGDSFYSTRGFVNPRYISSRGISNFSTFQLVK